MAIAAKKAPSGQPRSQLSSGILNMKFMQRDEEPAAPSPPPSEVREDAGARRGGFQPPKDPGEWGDASPVARNISQPEHAVGFLDLYDAPPTGRRTYGAPQRSAASLVEHQMVSKSKAEPPRGKKNKGAAGSPLEAPRKGRKRPSEPDDEETAADAARSPPRRSSRSRSASASAKRAKRT